MASRRRLAPARMGLSRGVPARMAARLVRRTPLVWRPVVGPRRWRRGWRRLSRRETFVCMALGMGWPRLPPLRLAAGLLSATKQ